MYCNFSVVKPRYHWKTFILRSIMECEKKWLRRNVRPRNIKHSYYTFSLPKGLSSHDQANCSGANAWTNDVDLGRQKLLR